MGRFINALILFIKGAVMGLGNVIPGVSGGTLAVVLGVYDKLIDSISTLFKKFKENIIFLLPLLLGMGAGIILSAKVIGTSLEKFPLATLLLFAGMIIGGLPLLYKKISGHMKNPSNYIVFIIVFLLLLLYTLLSKERSNELEQINFLDMLLFFALGIIGAATMLIPGISGSLTLMVLGYYEFIVTECVGNIMDFSKFGMHMQVLIPFALGCVVGIFLVAKLLDFLLKKFEVKTYFAIFGFIFASLIVMFAKKGTFDNYKFNVVELLIGIVLLVLGFSISYSFANKEICLLIFPLRRKKQITTLVAEEKVFDDNGNVQEKTIIVEQEEK